MAARAVSAVGFAIASFALLAECSADDSDAVVTSTRSTSDSSRPRPPDTAATTADGSGLPAVPERIICGTQYRPDADTTTGATSPTLVVERRDEITGRTETIEFDNMTLEVTYTGDSGVDGARTVNVVIDGGNEDDRLASTLYQFGDLDVTEINYAGGHGFTGLSYTYHEGSMLQVWCEAAHD